MGLQPAAGGAPPAEAAPAGAGACAAGALGLPPAGGPFAAIGGTAWGCSVLGMVVCVQRLIYRSNCSTLLSVLRWVYGGSRSTKPRSRRVDSSRAAKRPQASKELAVPKALQLSHTYPLAPTKTEASLERPQNDEAQDQAAQGRRLRDGDRRRQEGAPPRTPLARLSVSSCCCSIAGPLRRLVAAAGVGAQEDHRGDQEHDRAEADGQDARRDIDCRLRAGQHMKANHHRLHLHHPRP